MKALCGLALLFALAPGTALAQAPVGLGTAGAFAVLGGSTVTNTGPSVVNGDVGLSPGNSVTGFPPGTINGTLHVTDGVASQAQADTTTAYNDAAGRTPASAVAADLGGQTLVAGVYRSATSLGLTGDLTLDAQGDPSAVFIFQAGSTLTTASSSRVVMINGADACNVYWQVGSSATLGTNSVFKGTILALTSITLTTGATVDGRTLARNGAVTMDSNAITVAACAAAGPGTTTPGTGTTTPGAGAPGGGAAPGAGGPGSTTPVGIGTATLTPGPTGPSECMDGFRASVRGRNITRVVFTLDGRRLVTTARSPHVAWIRALRGGRHWVRARVTFSDRTRTRQLRFRYRACTAALLRVPRFTG